MKIKAWLKRLERNFNIFTGGLSIAEIEYLIKRDVPGMFEFYSQQYYVDKKRNILIRWFYLFGNMFLAFNAKLKPARRLVYVVALYMFISGLSSGNNLNLVFSFALVSMLLAFELADKLIAKDELEIARNIQLQLLPEKAPVHSLIDIVYFQETAREVGGDFYDFIEIDGKLFIVVGDISGKGMGAAIHMVQMHTIVQSLKQITDPRTLLIELNRKLDPIFPKSVFLTTSFFCLNGGSSADFYRCGHLPVLKYNAAQQTCDYLTPTGIGIGLSNPEKFEQSLQGMNIPCKPGDIFVLFTDGLVETMDQYMIEYGEERLTRVLCQHAEQGPVEIRDAILSSIAVFRGRALQHDDLTLVVIKCK